MSNTAVNLIHSSAISCSATLLPLLLISCLFANRFDNIGEAQNNFSGLGRWEGSGAALAGLRGKLASGREGQLHCVTWRGRRYSPPQQSLFFLRYDPCLPGTCMLLDALLLAGGVEK